MSEGDYSSDKLSNMTLTIHSTLEQTAALPSHTPLVSTAGSCQVAITVWSQIVTRFVRSFSSRYFSLTHSCCQLAATEGGAGDTFIVHVVL